MIKIETIGPQPQPVPDGYEQAMPSAIRWNCKTCGVGVIDHERHTEWHETNKTV